MTTRKRIKLSFSPKFNMDHEKKVIYLIPENCFLVSDLIYCIQRDFSLEKKIINFYMDYVFALYIDDFLVLTHWRVDDVIAYDEIMRFELMVIDRRVDVCEGKGKGSEGKGIKRKWSEGSGKSERNGKVVKKRRIVEESGESEKNGKNVKKKIVEEGSGKKKKGKKVKKLPVVEKSSSEESSKSSKAISESSSSDSDSDSSSEKGKSSSSDSSSSSSIFVHEKIIEEKLGSGNTYKSIDNSEDSNKNRISTPPRSLPKAKKNSSGSSALFLQPQIIENRRPSPPDFDALPAIKDIPSRGSSIAFKLFEVLENWTPGISDWKQAIILEVCGDILYLELDTPSSDSEDDEHNLNAFAKKMGAEERILEKKWTEIIDPKLITIKTNE